MSKSGLVESNFVTDKRQRASSGSMENVMGMRRMLFCRYFKPRLVRIGPRFLPEARFDISLFCLLVKGTCEFETRKNLVKKQVGNSEQNTSSDQITTYFYMLFRFTE